MQGENRVPWTEFIFFNVKVADVGRELSPAEVANQKGIFLREEQWVRNASKSEWPRLKSGQHQSEGQELTFLDVDTLFLYLDGSLDHGVIFQNVL